MYLVDTNVVSEARRATGRELAALKQKADLRGAAPLAEWLQKLRHDHADRILAVTDQISVEWGADRRLAPARTLLPALPAHLESLADRARAYNADWRHFAA